MVRSPSSLKQTTGLKKGSWTSDEDEILTNHIMTHGHPNWRALPRLAGLARCGKSCRLRWTNYLQPGIKRGNFTREEEEIIITSHQLLGNRWSAIAAKLPGRTDNEIKNVWHTHLKKKSLNKDQDIQQSSSATNYQSSNNDNHVEDFIIVDESIFDQGCWDVHSHLPPVQHPHADHIKNPNNDTASVACNNINTVYVPSFPLQRSYSETSYHNYKDVPSPEEFPETYESFWSDLVLSDFDHNNSAGSSSSSSIENFYQQQPKNGFSVPPVENITDSKEAHTTSSLFHNFSSNNAANVSDNSSIEVGGDVDDFWFDVLFRAGEHPAFLVDM